MKAGRRGRGADLPGASQLGVGPQPRSASPKPRIPIGNQFLMSLAKKQASVSGFLTVGFSRDHAPTVPQSVGGRTFRRGTVTTNSPPEPNRQTRNFFWLTRREAAYGVMSGKATGDDRD